MSMPVPPAPAPVPPVPTPPPAPVPLAPVPVPPAVPPVPVPPAPYAPPVPPAVPPVPMPTPPPVPTPPPTPPAEPRDISGLPAWAREEITGLRGESADRRVAARTADVKLHAYQTAGALGVNPDALLGSAAFSEAARNLDPSAPDFVPQLQASIQWMLQNNPWMAAQQGAPPIPGTSGGQFPGAPAGPQPTLDQQIATAQAAGDWKTVIALNSQMLAAQAGQQ